MIQLPLQTPRLHIAALRARDRELFCALFTDEHIMQFIGPPHARAAALRTFDAILRASTCKPRESIFYRIALRDTRAPIGICSLQQLDGARRIVEAGVMLLPERQGRGYGREALVALADTALRLFPFDEIRVQYHSDNEVAERSFIGAGFEPVAREGADTEGARMRILSAYRRTWRNPGNVHQLGVDACPT